jgi:hypothetical protein
MPVQYAVLGDARTTAEAVLAELDARGSSNGKSGRRNTVTRERIRSGDNHHSPYLDQSSERYIDPRTLSKAVDDILPKDRVVASDFGHFCEWVPRYLRVRSPKASCLAIHFNRSVLALHPRSVLPSPTPASSLCWVRAMAGSCCRWQILKRRFVSNADVHAHL